MKILLLSDSHKCMTRMERAVEREKPDVIFHMGDHLRDSQKLQLKYPDIPLYGVPGNCDMVDWDTPLSQVCSLDGVEFLLTHGHAFGVKSNVSELFFAAKQRGVSVAVFGHTHKAFCQERDGILLVNPGSCRSGGSWSYGILTTVAGKVTCQLMEMED